MEQSLSGVTVLVTRPAHQAGPLCDLLRQAGATALPFPAIAIVDPSDPAAFEGALARLEEYDLAIFISPNAARRTANLLHARRPWPSGVTIAAIGRGTARELGRCGLPPQICPRQSFNSEGLLALPEMQRVAGQRILIFRGEGGRELLGDTLRARGAEVCYVETYRRARPQGDVAELLRHWARSGVDVVTVSSSAGLHNLFDMVGSLGQQWLRQAQLVTLSERTAAAAAELGFRHPALVAGEAADEATVQAIIDWRRRQ